MENGSSGSCFYFTLPYKPVPPTSDDVSPTEVPEKLKIQSRRRRKLISSSPTESTTASANSTDCDQSSPQTTAATILLAEDDFVSRQIATRMLEQAGCTVLKAHNGAQAVSLFEQYRNTIDLILMDIMMPNMTGLEATKKIREIELLSSKASSNSSLESVPIVALSAGAMKGDRERGLQAGMNDYTNPFGRQQSGRCLKDMLVLESQRE
jgi:CheY-like chemotaxis protein